MTGLALRIPRKTILALLLFACTSYGAATFRIAGGGKASCRVVLPEEACPATRQAARVLTNYLHRITGTRFAIGTGDGKTGIAVGMASQFPELAGEPGLKLKERFSQTDLATKQSYVLRSHAAGVQIIGASEIGVLYGAWDFLYRLGYRQFFPTTAWEIVPNKPNLAIAVDDFEKPDYILRNIAGSVTQDWNERNRTSIGYSWKIPLKSYIPEHWQKPLIQNQHNWGSIISHSQEEFDAHPEYLGLVTVKVEPEAPVAPLPGNAVRNDGDDELGLDEPPVAEDDTTKTQLKRCSSKLCVSNPGVRRAAARYALDYFTKNPDTPSLSMEPSDGSGWCECEECDRIGPPSERVVLLANSVAEALEKDFPEKYLGILAYHLHANPPTRKVHPRVSVSLATALSGKMSLTDRLTGWAKVCKNLGVYEYLSVGEWHLGMPAKSLIGNVPRLTELIPNYHRQGVRFFTGQAAAGAWGAHGLGYVYISRLLWDIDEADRVEEIVDDFLTKAFEDAAEPMQEYYHVIDGSQARPGSAEFFLERAKLMYAALWKAKQATKSPTVQERINGLVLYTRYVELFALHGQAKGREKWPILCRWRRHTYRMRDKGMIEWLGWAIPNAKKVELRPSPEYKPGDDLGLDEPEPVVHLVDKPFTETDIMDFINGKANDWNSVDENKVPEHSQGDLLAE